MITTRYVVSSDNFNRHDEWWFDTEEAAEKIGVAPPCLNDIIKGKRKVSTKIAKKLETLFGVPAIVLMTWRAVDELNKE